MLALAALVFTIVNLVIKPILAILLDPVDHHHVRDRLLLRQRADAADDGLVVGDFEVGGFWTVVGATIVIWLVNAIISMLRDVQVGPRAGRKMY